MNDLRVDVVRRRRRQLRRPSGLRTKFLVMLLVAAVGAIAWQFARQQPVSTLAYSPAKKSGFTLPEIQDLKLESGAWAPSISSHLGRPIYLYSVIPAGIESVEELQKELLELRRAQFGLRMQLATQSLSKNSEMERVRRQIARVHTFLNQKAKASAK